MVAAVALMTAITAGADPARAGGTAPLDYEVTITNLTSVQWFTPPVVASHLRSTGVFTVGSAASSGVQEVAENGNVPALVDELNTNSKVRDVVAGDAPLGPGQSVSLTISGTPGFSVSIVAMLICTNDGFTGVDSLRLPPVGSVSVTSNAYDAGTEINTEDLADIVPPCQELNGVTDDMGSPGTGMSDPELAEDGVIHQHAGITGVADLTVDAHGWTDPVAAIEVTRLG
jgi:hypothetical protein